MICGTCKRNPADFYTTGVQVIRLVCGACNWTAILKQNPIYGELKSLPVRESKKK